MCVTNEDVLAAIDDGLKAGSAKSVDGQGRCLLPHAASQGNMARNVCGVDGRTERNNVSSYKIVDCYYEVRGRRKKICGRTEFDLT